MRSWVLLILGAIALSGCHFNYSEMQASEQFESTIPEFEFTDVFMIVSEGGVDRVRITAGRLQHFTTKKETHFFDAQLEELGPAGELLSRGSAEEAVMNTDTEDATFNKSVTMYSEREQGTLTASGLSWKKDQNELQGQGRVRLSREDGSFIEGTEFVARLKRNSIEFGKSVQGSMVEQEADE